MKHQRRGRESQRVIEWSRRVENREGGKSATLKCFENVGGFKGRGEGGPAGWLVDWPTEVPQCRQVDLLLNGRLSEQQWLPSVPLL